MPDISILIAARNEAATIGRCLEAVAALRLPAGSLEVLVGDDRSEDQTAAIVQAFIRDKPQFRLISVRERLGQQAGKANVLAHLAREARGRYLLFTDADIQVPPTWAETLIQPFADERVGIVTGCTEIRAPGAWAGCQAIEWLFVQYTLKQLADHGIPITAMGNNMAVRHEAYRKVGGYEALPFSVVEDFQLFNAIRDQGYSFAHRLEEPLRAITLPVPTLGDWLRQRKRWMVGAVQTPWYFVALFTGLAGWYPFLLVLGMFQPPLALALWLGKWALQSIALVTILRFFRRNDLVKYLFLYDGYAHLTALLSVLYYLWPTAVTWKGRTYVSARPIP